MIRQWAALIFTILAVVAIGVLSIYVRFTNVDMTETQILLTYWKEASILAIWLFASLFLLEKVR